VAKIMGGVLYRSVLGLLSRIETRSRISQHCRKKEYREHETYEYVVQDIGAVGQSSDERQNGIPHTISGRTLADSQPLQEHVDREIAQPRCIHTVSEICPIYKVWERRVEELGIIGVVDCESGDFGVNAAHRGLDLLVEARTSQNQI
jgi:hypothetical protein